MDDNSQQAGDVRNAGLPQAHASPRQKKKHASSVLRVPANKTHTPSHPALDGQRSSVRLLPKNRPAMEASRVCSSEVVLAPLCVLFFSVCGFLGLRGWASGNKNPPSGRAAGPPLFSYRARVTGRDSNGLQAQTCAFTTYWRALCAR